MALPRKRIEMQKRNVQKQQGVQQQQTGLGDTRGGGIKAACFVDSDGAAPTYRRQRGFAATAIVRTGAGDVTLTLAEPLDIGALADRMILATVEGPALHTISVEQASATTLRVRTNTITAVPAVAPADLDFHLVVLEFGPN